MVEGRLRSRIPSLGLDSFSEYCDFVFPSGGTQDEFIHLVAAITTNKTEFFREPAHFYYLKNHLLPSMLTSRDISPERPLRVWSAACSTGQEPYSLAMELAVDNRLQEQLYFQIFATDISTQVLETCKKAIYNVDVAAGIPRDFQKRYLLKETCCCLYTAQRIDLFFFHKSDTVSFYHFYQGQASQHPYGLQ